MRAHALPSDRGVAVVSVSEKSPAEAAGVRPGDVILDLAGTPVTGIDDLHRVLTEDRIGELLPLRVLRRGEPRRVLVTPSETA